MIHITADLNTATIMHSFITDLNEQAKGLQLLFLSYAQYCDLNERCMKLWQKKLDKNANYPCPISSAYNAYPV